MKRYEVYVKPESGPLTCIVRIGDTRLCTEDLQEAIDWADKMQRIAPASRYIVIENPGYGVPKIPMHYTGATE
jgi:hypothetical protein